MLPIHQILLQKHPLLWYSSLVSFAGQLFRYFQEDSLEDRLQRLKTTSSSQILQRIRKLNHYIRRFDSGLAHPSEDCGTDSRQKDPETPRVRHPAKGQLTATADLQGKLGEQAEDVYNSSESRKEDTLEMRKQSPESVFGLFRKKGVEAFQKFPFGLNKVLLDDMKELFFEKKLERDLFRDDLKGPEAVNLKRLVKREKPDGIKTQSKSRDGPKNPKKVARIKRLLNSTFMSLRSKPDSQREDSEAEKPEKIKSQKNFQEVEEQFLKRQNDPIFLPQLKKICEDVTKEAERTKKKEFKPKEAAKHESKRVTNDNWKFDLSLTPKSSPRGPRIHNLEENAQAGARGQSPPFSRVCIVKNKGAERSHKKPEPSKEKETCRLGLFDMPALAEQGSLANSDLVLNTESQGSGFDQTGEHFFEFNRESGEDNKKEVFLSSEGDEKNSIFRYNLERRPALSPLFDHSAQQFDDESESKNKVNKKPIQEASLVGKSPQKQGKKDKELLRKLREYFRDNQIRIDTETIQGMLLLVKREQEIANRRFENASTPNQPSQPQKPDSKLLSKRGAEAPNQDTYTRPVEPRPSHAVAQMETPNATSVTVPQQTRQAVMTSRARFPLNSKFEGICDISAEQTVFKNIENYLSNREYDQTLDYLKKEVNDKLQFITMLTYLIRSFNHGALSMDGVDNSSLLEHFKQIQALQLNNMREDLRFSNLSSTGNGYDKPARTKSKRKKGAGRKTTNPLMEETMKEWVLAYIARHRR